MKRTALVFTILFAASISMAVNAQAALIGFQLSLPDIFSDTTGSYSYDASTDLFTSTAKALTITFDGVNLIPITSGSYSASFYVNSSGNYYQ